MVFASRKITEKRKNSAMFFFINELKCKHTLISRQSNHSVPIIWLTTVKAVLLKSEGLSEKLERRCKILNNNTAVFACGIVSPYCERYWNVCFNSVSKVFKLFDLPLEIRSAKV